MKIAAALMPLFRALCTSVVIRRIWLIVEIFFLNPVWFIFNKLVYSRYSFNFFAIIASHILAINLNFIFIWASLVTLDFGPS